MSRTLHEKLERIASALERLAPPSHDTFLDPSEDFFVWVPGNRSLKPVHPFRLAPLSLLKSIDRQKKSVLENTYHFANGSHGNNILIWGARGMGKSTLVKASIRAVLERKPHALALIEIRRDDLSTLSDLLTLLSAQSRRCVVFCDDLSFEFHDADYKMLKSVLDGGLSGQPDHIIFYATSNRRHLMPRQMIDIDSQTAINPQEAVDEKVSLSDRFGLWIGLYACSQDAYLDIVETHAEHRKLAIARTDLHERALLWAMERGARSGRVATQFVDHLAATLDEASHV